MRTKVTLVLLFLNVALFYFIFFVRGDLVAPPVEKRVIGEETANLQSLVIATTEPASVTRLERRDERWFITEPLQWPAAELAVRSIINELQFLRPITTFSVEELGKAGESLANFGLEKPPLTLTFTPAVAPGTPPAEPIVLRIGNPTKLSNRLYILSPDGKRVHVVDRSLAESLTIGLDRLRNDELFTIPVYEAKAFTLERAGERVRFLRDDERWNLENPIRTRANKNATEVTISSLSRLQVENFLDAARADPARTGLATPTLRITVEGNKRRQTLLLGAPVEPSSTATAAPSSPARPASATADATAAEKTTAYYAQIENDQLGLLPGKTPTFTVQVPDDLLTRLRNAQKDLRERRIVDASVSAVSGISLAAAPQPELTLQRLETSPLGGGSSAWQIVRPSESGPVRFAADAEIVGLLLKHIFTLEAEEFPNDAAVSAADEENYGFSRPAREITLSFSAPTTNPTSVTTNQLPIVVQVGNGADGRVYARLRNQNYVYLVSPEILNQTPVSPLVYRERVVRDLPAGAQITAIKLVELGGRPEKILLDATIPPAAPTTDAAAPEKPLDVIVASLRTLRAKRFVAEEFTKTVFAGGEERAWKYRLDTTLSLVGGAGAQATVSELYIAERTGGGTQLVGSPRDNVVFEAEQPFLDALFALTYGPRDPGPTPPAPTPAPAPAPTPSAGTPDAR